MPLRPVRAALASAAALGALLAPAAQAEMRALTAWGSEGKGPDQFALPDGVVADNGGNVWVADSQNNRILRFRPDGTPRPFHPFRTQKWSDADGRFRLPYGLAVDPLGFIYVADTQNHRIQQFTPDGRFIRKWGGLGLGDGQFNQPRGIALDPLGNVWVADHENRRVQKFDREGRFLLKVGANGGDGTLGSGPGEFNAPRGLSSDAQGNIYVADDANHRIVKLANDGTYIRDYGGSWDNPGAGDGQFNLPYDTAVDLEGHVWVADTKNSRLVEFDPADGRVLSRWGASGGDGTPGRGLGEMDHVYTVDVDCVGNVYVTDAENHRVHKIGDPSAPPGVCPPRLTVGRVSGRGGITAEAVCDRPCRANATATVSVPGRRRPVRVRAPEQNRWEAGSVTLRIPLPAAVRRAKRARHGLVARLRVSASGAPGAESSTTRRVRLR